MAVWRRASELPRGEENTAKLRSIAIEDRAGEPGRTCADVAGLSGKSVVFLRSGCIIRPSSVEMEDRAFATRSSGCHASRARICR
jgi:hypothetical protein